MAFKPKAGKVKIVYFPVTPSTALSADSIVTFTSGKLVAATAGTTLQNISGVLVKAITASDADYASDRLVGVQVPLENNTLWEADVTSGLVAADVGIYCDLTSATHVNRGASSIDVALCVGVISSTKGLFQLGIRNNY